MFRNTPNVVLAFFALIISLNIGLTSSCKEHGANNGQLGDTLYTVSLSSDGPNIGMDPYTIVTNKLGAEAIEAPDLYENNHVGVHHLYEDTDKIVGNHFVFTMHLNEDGNKDEGQERAQRNEIKVYAKSPDSLIGHKNRSFGYKWKFKIDTGITIGDNRHIFFQLKAGGGTFKTPLISLSAKKNKSGSGNVLEVRHKGSPRQKKIERLDSLDFKHIPGKWYEVTCKATFSNAKRGGYFYLNMVDLESGKTILHVDRSSIDMWPGDDPHFIRPKWGYVRSLKDRESLRTDEERIRIADIEIYRFNNKSKVHLKHS